MVAHFLILSHFNMLVNDPKKMSSTSARQTVKFSDLSQSDILHFLGSRAASQTNLVGRAYNISELVASFK